MLQFHHYCLIFTSFYIGFMFIPAAELRGTLHSDHCAVLLLKHLQALFLEEGISLRKTGDYISCRDAVNKAKVS
jgi:hypothetical protein